MMPSRTAFLAALLAASTFAVVTPAAHAAPWDGASANLAGECGTSSGNEGQGGTAGTNSQVCMAAGVTNIGPSVGQNANLVGPTIAPGTVTGPVIVAAGDVAVNGVGL